MELQTEPPEADTESTNLPDDDAENPVGGIRYPTIQIIHTFTFSADGRQPDDFRAADGASGSRHRINQPSR